MHRTSGVPNDWRVRGHPCDGCGACRKGVCCRRTTELAWPQLGDWEGPIYGELGVLVTEEDGDRLVCHACGQSYRNLGTHVVQAHQLLAFEYKAIFGLRRRPASWRPYWPSGTASTTWRLEPVLAQATRGGAQPDSRTAFGVRARPDLGTGSPPRSCQPPAVAGTDPARPAGARAARESGRRWWRIHARIAARGQARVAELRQDPVWVARWREKYEAGRARSRDPRQTLGHEPKAVHRLRCSGHSGDGPKHLLRSL